MPDTDGVSGRPEKGAARTSGMNAHGKSDGCIVPGKPANNGERLSPAESVEGRRPTEGNVSQTAAHRTQRRVCASIGLRRVREARRIRLCAITRGRSRVLENCTHGSVRGAARKGGPYRDRDIPNAARRRDLRDAVSGFRRSQPSRAFRHSTSAATTVFVTATGAIPITGPP